MKLIVLVVMALVVSGCADSADIDVERTIDDRPYRLFVPAEATEPVPLVLVLHGFGGTPADVRRLTGFDEVARDAGFAVAYPRAAGFIPAWRTDPILSGPDVEFLRAVVADIPEVVEVDPRRVYAAGMSNGGGMAGRLACDAADVFAAVGAVAAAHVPGACGADRAVPIVAFHGTADRIVPFEGRGPLLLAPGEWVAARAGEAECAGSEETPIADDVVVIAGTGCEADVQFYVIDGGRHGWPGSGRSDTTQSIDASAIMAEFFARHPLEP